MAGSRLWGLTILWVAFGFYATFFPPCAVAAGKFLKSGGGTGPVDQEIVRYVKILVEVLAPLPFLQALSFGFMASATYDLMADEHYPGHWPTFGTIVIVSILLVAIGFYAAVAAPEGDAEPQHLVAIQLMLTMAGIGVASVLKFSQLKAAP